MFLIYDIFFFIFAIFYMPYMLLSGRCHKGILQRLGFYPEEVRQALGSKGAIWLHAVSVGEVNAVKPFWEGLRRDFPGRKLICSTVTRTGNKIARAFAKPGETVCFFPLDLSFIAGRIFGKSRLGAFIIAETELWPNVIRAVHKKGIPVILINGRISDKAYARYKIVSLILKDTLRRVRVFCMRSRQDEDRIISLGAPRQNVRVTGNMKFDAAKHQGREEDRPFAAPPDKETVFVAGSTHPGEEEIVLRVYKKLLKERPGLKLVIAPRHIDRAGRIRELIKKFDFEPDSAPVVVDTFGRLEGFYSIASLVFVGGSLIKHGGHNIIEPAIYKKAILFGPFMFNFRDIAGEFLKGNAAIEIKNEGDMLQKCSRLLAEPELRAEIGQRAYDIVRGNMGAAERNLAALKGVLKNA
ncbi:MAG: glycosyltransferase N-terminal domain-containing protein [Candidatus Omnitrophota bacterium]